MNNLNENQKLINQFESAVFFIDINKKIRLVNDKFCQLTHFQEKDLLDLDYTTILKESSASQSNPVLNSLKQKKERLFLNYILKDANNNSQIVDVHAIPIQISSEYLHCLFLIPKTSNNTRPVKEILCDGALSDYGLIGNTSAIHEISYLIKTVAPTEATVLILGETGTGKDIVAQIIHQLSPRKDEIFKTINCATYSENLLENELFGHEKGAYTGADTLYKGLFETASQGTLFLDEIGEISPQFQAKLLRILQSGEYNRIGSAETRKTDIRIIAATNRNLKKMIQENKFREDLYYRLNIFPINLPPLKERITDIPLLVDHFIATLNKKYKKNKTGLGDIALTLLFSYHFPGNIRELKNIIEHSFIKSKEHIIHDYDLPNYLLEDMNIKKSLDQTKDLSDKINFLMKEFNGNKTKVAKALGISRKTLYSKLDSLD